MKTAIVSEIRTFLEDHEARLLRLEAAVFDEGATE